MAKWVNLSKILHDTGIYRSYHKTFKILGKIIYTERLPHEQQTILDKAQKNQQIDFLITDDPVKDVLDIVKTVAVDPRTIKDNCYSSIQLIQSVDK